MVGRRRLGGGGRPISVFQPVLRRRIESCKNSYTTIDQLVQHLRTTFPEFARHKIHPFTRQVEQILEHIKNPDTVTRKTSDNSSHPKTSNVDIDDHEHCTPFHSPVLKKMKIFNKSEEKLQHLETQHIPRTQKVRRGHHSSSSSSLVSTSSSSSVSRSSSSSDGTVADLTSEDAVYGEKFEPEFDLMKSMLRTTYSESKNGARSKAPTSNEEKNLEMEEVVQNKGKYLVQEDGTQALGVNDEKREAKGLSDSGPGGDISGKEGPRFEDLGGMSGLVEELIKDVLFPLYHPTLLRSFGTKPISGVLLHGPPGCGKTQLAHAIANEAGVPFYNISATEMVSGISGASEANIRELFSKAYRTAPSIIFIDEIDAIASKRENLQREMEKRMVTQLLTCMSESRRNSQPSDKNTNSENSDGIPGHVLVIGATNRPDAIDPALRRPGRFEKEFALGVPNENARAEILSVLTRNLKLEGAFDIMKIARSTPGFVGADMEALVTAAGNHAISKLVDKRKYEFSKEFVGTKNTREWLRRLRHPLSPEEMQTCITMCDFEEAIHLVQPSTRREGFSTIPSVKWEDVGGLHSLRREFNDCIVERIKYPEDYNGFGLGSETGFLLYGPPGCGKTLIAMAVANESGANFIHVKGPELLNKYVGESELAVRTIFTRARTCAPCIIFFDEVDGLTTERGNEGGLVVDRILNQLLIELSGGDKGQGVYVIGATNRPHAMDPAILRSGRFGKLLYVPLPTPDERGLILKALCRNKPVDATVDLMLIGRDEHCKNLSGADLSKLVDKAAFAAYREKRSAREANQLVDDGTSQKIMTKHFERALAKISPTVKDEDIRFHESLHKNFGTDLEE